MNIISQDSSRHWHSISPYREAVLFNYFFVGPAGVSVSGNVDWLGGDSLILPGGLAAMAVPLLGRWCAAAMDVDLGASAGGFLAGSVPRFSLSPSLTLSVPVGESFRVGINEMASLLLSNRGPGFYNHVTAIGAVTWKDGKILAGPTLAFFAMPACGPTWCGDVRGFGAGGSLRVDLFEKPLGVSFGCNVDVPLKSTDLLSNGPALMFFAGGVFRLL